MRVNVLHQQDARRTLVVVLDKGDEAMAGLKRAAQEHKLDSSHFTAIGAFSAVTLGFFDRETLEYQNIPVGEQVEVLSLIGNITLNQGEVKVHAHVVLGRRDGAALGGHLLEARVWPTLEVVIVEEPGHLRRQTDAATGLALINVREGE